MLLNIFRHLKYEINIFQRPSLKLRDREMKESTFSHSVIDINKIRNPSPIYCFLLHCWVHICPETAFMDLLLSRLLFVCLGTFWTRSVTQRLPVETSCSLQENSGCSLNSSLFLVSSSCQPHFYSFTDKIFPFTAAVTICYDLACQLCAFTFLNVRGIWIRVIVFLFEWQARTSVYTEVRRLFYTNVSKLINTTLQIFAVMLMASDMYMRNIASLVWGCRLFILCSWNLFFWQC